MKTKREVLEKAIINLIPTYGKNRKVIKAIQDEFQHHNILPGDVQSLFAMNIHLSTISQVLLCIFCVAFHKVTGENTIEPTKFFTDLELKESSKWKKDIEEKAKYPIVFNNVERLNDDMWVTSMTAQEIADLYSRRSVVYNPETQRALKKKEFKNKIIEEIDINKSSVQEIKNNILDGKFISNYITFNMLQNGEEEFTYDEKSRTLTVFAGEFNILDGFHRSLGITYAVQENSNVDFKCGITITYFDLDKARRFIVQEDKKNKMNTKYIKSLNVDHISNLIVRKINEHSHSYLKGKITIDEILLKSNKCLVDFNVLTDIIEQTFMPKDNKDLVSMSKKLIDGINYIIEQLPELLETKKPFVDWAFYISLLKQAYGTDNWKDFINEHLYKVSNIPVEDMNVNNINKKAIQKINAYVESLVG